MCRNEPRLEQLLADPLIQLMMSSDGVDEGDLRRLARGHASHRARGAQRPAGAPGRHADGASAYGCTI